MTAWTHNDLLWLRVRLKEGYSMQRLCDVNPRHTRDEIVEAIDSLRRYASITEAQKRVNFILACQSAGEPLVNGNPQSVVCRQWGRATYAPMF